MAGTFEVDKHIEKNKLGIGNNKNKWVFDNCVDTWAPFQYWIKRVIVRCRDVSKPRDRQFKLSYRCEIWLARRQQCCRGACQISERSDYSKYKSRGIETSRDLTIRRLIGYWNGALEPSHIGSPWVFILILEVPRHFSRLHRKRKCVENVYNFVTSIVSSRGPAPYDLNVILGSKYIRTDS